MDPAKLPRVLAKKVIATDNLQNTFAFILKILLTKARKSHNCCNIFSTHFFFGVEMKGLKFTLSRSEPEVGG